MKIMKKITIVTDNGELRGKITSLSFEPATQQEEALAKSQAPPSLLEKFDVPMLSCVLVFNGVVFIGFYKKPITEHVGHWLYLTKKNRSQAILLPFALDAQTWKLVKDKKGYCQTVKIQ